MRISAFALLLLALPDSRAEALVLVDIDAKVSLGTVVVDEEAGRVWFSLGNGRGISYSSAVGEGRAAQLQQALLKQPAGTAADTLERRNIRWQK